MHKSWRFHGSHTARLAHILSDDGRRGIQIFTTCQEARRHINNWHNTTFHHTEVHCGTLQSECLIEICPNRSHVTYTAAVNVSKHTNVRKFSRANSNDFGSVTIRIIYWSIVALYAKTCRQQVGRQYNKTKVETTNFNNTQQLKHFVCKPLEWVLEF